MREISSSCCPCGHLFYRRLTSVKIPLMNISPYRTDANLSNLIDSTVVITCTQKLPPTMWTRSKLRLIFTQACQIAALSSLGMQMNVNKQENKYKHNGRRLFNVAMLGSIQMTKSEMSCDGCYHKYKYKCKYKYKQENKYKDNGRRLL